MADELLKGIENFINRPVSKTVADRVSKYVTKLGSGNVSKERVFKTDAPELNSGIQEDRPEWSSVQAFFSPVGYRPLFEQEIVFLMSEGVSYESILKMPVHLRKKLIDRKLDRGDQAKHSDEPDIPAHLLEQFRMSASDRRMAESPLPPRG